MGRNVELHCRCGEVVGHVEDASPSNTNHAVCYCDDCQAYLHHLGRTDLLDAHGGTDIVQVAPAALTFDRGAERIAGVRLSPKGLYRWYATCCKTPVGNTMGPALPFVGLVAQTLKGPGADPDEIFGKSQGGFLGKFAIGNAPEGSDKLNFPLLFRAARRLLSWKLGGKTWPHPFLDRATGKPRPPVTVLSRADRDSLRPLCGPHPTAQSA